MTLSDSKWKRGKRCLWSALVLCLLAQGPVVYASEPVQLWIQSIFGSRQTHTHFKPFFDEAFSSTGRSYKTFYSNDFEALRQRCRHQHYDVIMGSYSAAMQRIEQDCGYLRVAYTVQPIHLYTRAGQSLADIRRLGIVPGIRAADVEFESVIPGGAITAPFRNHIAATLALLEGEIDALSSAPVAIQRLSPTLKDRLVIAHTFKDSGQGVVLLSPQFLASDDGEAFRQFVLSNGETSRRIYVDGMGISLWHAP